MSSKAKLAGLALLVGSYMAMLDILSADLGLILVLLAAVASWRYMSGSFWRSVVAGLAGGAVAGLLILGPGFRLAMRAVALMDPIHPQEFSIGGTAFIVIGIGMIMGGVQGVTAQVARRALAIDSAVVAGLILAGIELVSLVFFSGDLSQEFFDLGISPWVNIPLFGVFAVGYGIAAMAIADRVELKLMSRRSTEREKLPV